MKNTNLLEVLEKLDPSTLNYGEWNSIGMALKTEGYTAADFDKWSRRDPDRYHEGECYRKWTTYDSNEIKGGTIIHIAQDHGAIPRKGEHAHGTQIDRGHALAWDAEIGAEKPVLDQTWVKDVPVIEPCEWDPKNQLRRYLQVLFQPEDIVGYVTETYDVGNGILKPTKGDYSKTCKELLRELDKDSYHLDDCVGTIKPDAGAWIRFNPLDGRGVDDSNVTDYRYTLVESDNTPIDRQNAIIRELKLPVAALVYSGGKSVHAIVRIEARNRQEYKDRVNYLYKVCKKNGLDVDKQNKNASRLSRMPGAERNYKGVLHKQFLIDTNLGFPSWDEWKGYIEEISDDLPDIVNLFDVAQDPPPLAPEIIKGVLRRGHKMLIAGPSKAGKSYMLINLALAFAYGANWLGRKCTQGRVLYINLEVDSASSDNRALTVAQAHGYDLNTLESRNMDIWNLRGQILDANALATSLIRRAKDKQYIAIIIDPIYKLNTGDENSAGDMAKFLGQFDRICHETGAAAIYCHHFTKGAQGGKKAMDRASGSGVFARDPDAIITLTDIERDQNQQQYLEDHLENLLPDWRARDGESSQQARNRIIEGITGWRVDMTLREFQSPQPFNVWWAWPTHVMDTDGILQEGHIKGEATAEEWKDKGVEFQRKKREGNVLKLEMAFQDLCKEKGTNTIKVKELVDDLGASRNSVKNWISESENLERDDGGNVYWIEPEFPI